MPSASPLYEFMMKSVILRVWYFRRFPGFSPNRKSEIRDKIYDQMEKYLQKITGLSIKENDPNIDYLGASRDAMFTPRQRLSSLDKDSIPEITSCFAKPPQGSMFAKWMFIMNLPKRDNYNLDIVDITNGAHLTLENIANALESKEFRTYLVNKASGTPIDTPLTPDSDVAYVYSTCPPTALAAMEKKATDALKSIGEEKGVTLQQYLKADDLEIQIDHVKLVDANAESDGKAVETVKLLYDMQFQVSCSANPIVKSFNYPVCFQSSGTDSEEIGSTWDIAQD